jgi:hypothetical protein
MRAVPLHMDEPGSAPGYPVWVIGGLGVRLLSGFRLQALGFRHALQASGTDELMANWNGCQAAELTGRADELRLWESNRVQDVSWAPR